MRCIASATQNMLDPYVTTLQVVHYQSSTEFFLRSLGSRVFLNLYLGPQTFSQCSPMPAQPYFSDNGTFYLTDSQSEGSN
jgi:hypothetical protein